MISIYNQFILMSIYVITIYISDLPILMDRKSFFNLNFIFETFWHLPFPSFKMTYYNICIQSLFVARFCNFYSQKQFVTMTHYETILNSAQWARITPTWNCYNKRNAETIWRTLFLPNSDNNNNNDINTNNSTNNSNSNNNINNSYHNNNNN